MFRLGALIILSLATLSAAASSRDRAPSFVYILVDDLGWGDLSCYGQEHWATPRLDQMAAEGMLFTNAYSGNTVCAPSRAALLTGNHTGRVFQRGNGKVQFRRDPHDITIATRLRDLGYATAMIGKSGVACNSNDLRLPNDKGFDHFYGLLSHTEAHRNYPKRIVRNGAWVELPGNKGYTGDTYVNELWVQDALEWMGEQRDRPFFLHLALTPPHADLTVPARYMEPFRGRFEETPNTRGGYYHQQEPRAAYAGMVAFLDESVGRVLDRLRELGIAENTVVFFASDNGPHFEGGAHPDAFDSNGPYRGGKRDMSDGGIKTPQIAWWPGSIAAGQTTELVTAFWDFPATALDLAGDDVPATMDGISIAPTLLGRKNDQREHKYLYWEFHEQGGKQAVRMGRWKGIRLNAAANPDGPIALYDLANDIGEESDVSAEHPEVVASIAAAMREAHEPSAMFRFGRAATPASRPSNERRLSNPNDRLVLDRSSFRVVRTSSESGHNGAVGANVLDNDLDTRWHTMWRDQQPEHPHSITIDLGDICRVSGIRVMARQDATTHGTVRELDVSVSEDRLSPGTRAASASLAFTKDEQEIMFETAVRGRYLTLTSRSAHDDSAYACFSNIEVLGSYE